MFVIGGCPSVRATQSQPRGYFWASVPQDERIHPAVACTSLHALITFTQLFPRDTSRDRVEQATLLGESSLYTSDAPSDPPCQRAGHPVGPINTPSLADRVVNIRPSRSGTVSFKWDGAHNQEIYYTYPEYLVSAEPMPER